MDYRLRLTQPDIQWQQRLRQKEPVLPHEFPIKPNFAAAAGTRLNQHDVPMDFAAIGVVRRLIGIARSQVHRAADLLVEQRIEHRLLHFVVEPQRPLADVPRSVVGIENLVEPFVLPVGAGRAFDPTILELEPDAIEDDALIERLRVVGDDAVDAVSDGSRKALAIRDIPQPVARHDRDALDRERQVRLRRDDANSIGALHEFDERLLVLGHAAIVGSADAKIKILEVLSAALSRLSH